MKNIIINGKLINSLCIPLQSDSEKKPDVTVGISKPLTSYNEPSQNTKNRKSVMIKEANDWTKLFEECHHDMSVFLLINIIVRVK